MPDVKWSQCETPSANFTTRMLWLASYTRQPGDIEVTYYFAPENLTHYQVHNHEDGRQMWFRSQPLVLRATVAE